MNVSFKDATLKPRTDWALWGILGGLLITTAGCYTQLGGLYYEDDPYYEGIAEYKVDNGDSVIVSQYYYEDDYYDDTYYGHPRHSRYRRYFSRFHGYPFHPYDRWNSGLGITGMTRGMDMGIHRLITALAIHPGAIRAVGGMVVAGDGALEADTAGAMVADMTMAGAMAADTATAVAGAMAADTATAVAGAMATRTSAATGKAFGTVHGDRLSDEAGSATHRNVAEEVCN